MRITTADLFELGQFQIDIQVCMTAVGLLTFGSAFTCNACELHTLG